MSTTPADFPRTTVAASEPIIRAPAQSVARTRLQSIDMMRGFVMVLMALDHVRHYFSSVHFGLLDPNVTTAPLYLTRAEALRTFGRVPLFFYVLHIVLAHLAAGMVGLMQGRGFAIFTAPFMRLPADWGFPLAGVYLAWGVVLAVAYPLCRWFADLKQRRNDWWLAYL